jgi:diguanylate cyclase (GGDEF)-like protein/PAS domain S-box-containing protein
MITLFIATAVPCVVIAGLAPNTVEGRHVLQFMLALIFLVSGASALHLLAKWLLTPLRQLTEADTTGISSTTPLPANACDEIVRLHTQLRARAQTLHDDTAALAAQGMRLQLIVDHHPQPLVAMDDRGFVSYANAAARRLLALDSVEDCIGRSITELTHHMLPDGRRYSASNTPMAQAFREGIRWHSHHEWFMDANGNRFAVRYSVSPIRENQQVLGGVLEFEHLDDNKAAALSEDSLSISLPAHLQHVIARAQRYHYFGAIMLLRLGNMTSIIDQHGEAIATPLLAQMAERARQALRREDVVAMYRPNQLALCLPELAPNSEAAAIHARLVTQQLLSALKPLLHVGGVTIAVECSVGITLFPEATDSPDAALRRADMALFESESLGTPTYLFSQLAADSSEISQQLQQDLGLAIERGQLAVHYQKIVDSSGQASGIEALLRWQHPERGLLLPEKFLPLADNNRFMLALDQWVLQQVIALLVEHRPDINKLLWVSANVSELSLKQPHFCENLQRMLLDAGVPPERLCLDLPEIALAGSTSPLHDVVNQLSRLGVRLALDDFGIQPIALTQLPESPIQYVKLAQRFLLDGSWDRHRDNVQLLLALAALCGKTIIAEGVETTTLHKQLADSGCHLFQGYCFGPPRPLAQLAL